MCDTTPSTDKRVVKILVTRSWYGDPECIIYSPFVTEIIFTEVSRQFHALFLALRPLDSNQRGVALVLICYLIECIELQWRYFTKTALMIHYIILQYNIFKKQVSLKICVLVV